MTPESPRAGLGLMRELYGAERSEDCLSLSNDLWKQFSEEADACLGECWRFAMIAATKLGRPAEAIAWRSRAQSAFARSGCRNGTAMAMLPDFFRMLDVFPDEPERALAILDAMAATIGGPDDPVDGDMARGAVLEKRGFLRARLGSDRRDAALLNEARADYEQALAVTQDLRRQLKIRAARASVDFLLATTSDQRQAAVADLENVLGAAESSAPIAQEVVRVGRANLQRMTDGRTDFEPYEVL